MAWFRNFYKCDRCDHRWSSKWSCMCDDDCPDCDARHMSPYDSHDLTEVISEKDGKFVVLRSPESAEHYANYYELGSFANRTEAEAFLAKCHNETKIFPTSAT